MSRLGFACVSAVHMIQEEFLFNSVYIYPKPLCREERRGNREEEMEQLLKCQSQFVDAGFSSEDLRLVKRLGQGNMSTVFLAVHRDTNKAFAVKVMNKEILQQRNAYKMAATEKDILSSLNHPFLPSLLTHFESENHTFLVMEYCSGGDISVLRHRQPGQTFPESTIRFYAAEVVIALEYLHEK
ncbi:hypothetical protein SUGI_0293640 [Cryptomeria japonica]|uniref:serine/threonine-protein kinase D6PKL3-like n=1 Tax=Cryptomeria japonica TaxID=3369 RepID=UPI002408C3BC|nr:serine/threonine-protein kinase D6PKL3-like [Cryptomeria japonica]GLJ16980.1 hypothetical protein SUGI_0293640 [Cryptomeria japonica]